LSSLQCSPLLLLAAMQSSSPWPVTMDKYSHLHWKVIFIIIGEVLIENLEYPHILVFLVPYWACTFSFFVIGWFEFCDSVVLYRITIRSCACIYMYMYVRVRNIGGWRSQRKTPNGQIFLPQGMSN
jgi:hypothetical protein